MSEQGFYGISAPAPNMTRVGEVVLFVDHERHVLASLMIGVHPGNVVDLQVFEMGKPPRQELNVPLVKNNHSGVQTPRSWRWIGG